MYTLHTLLESFLIHPFLQRAALLCILSSVLCALMGAILMSGRTTFLGDALSHGMLPGITLGTLMGGPWWSVSFLGAISGVILTSIALWTSQHRALDMNSSIAGIYLIAIAISMFWGGSEEIMHAFFGSILTIPQSYVYVLAGCTVISSLFCYFFLQDLRTYSFDADFACRAYPKMVWIYRGWIGLFVFNSAVQFQGMGALVVLGLTVLPFLSFYVLETHVRTILWKSILWNMGATLFSLLLSCYTDWPYGPTLLLILGTGYASALVYSRLYFPHFWRMIVLCCVFPFLLEAQRPHIVTSSKLLKHIVEILSPKGYIIDTLAQSNHFHHAPCTARNLIKLSQTDLIIIHGTGIDTQWIPIFQSLEVKARILILSRKVQFYPNVRAHELQTLSHKDLISDGHLWHDPRYVIQYVQIIGNTLIHMYPEWTSHIRWAQKLYINDLIKLDQWIKKQWYGRKKGAGLLAHSGMAHYQNRYGITLYAVPEERHQQGKYLKNLMERNICAIFPEQGHHPQVLHQWALDLKTQIASPLCIDDISLGTTYLDMMRKNTKSLLQGLVANLNKKKTVHK